MISLTIALLVILGSIIALYLWHIRQVYDFFVRRHIPGPKPMLFFGNLIDIVRTKRPSSVINQWTEKFGPIYGYFEGHTPILVVSDPDVLQDLLISSFSKFHARRESPFNKLMEKEISVFAAVGPQWKRQRQVINPTFSSAKLKQMSPLLHRSMSILMKNLEDQCSQGTTFDICQYFKRFTMDTIWSCGFGLDRDMQNDPNDRYLVYSQRIFARDNLRQALLVLTLVLSEWKSVWNAAFRIWGQFQNWLVYHVPMLEPFIKDNTGVWLVDQAYAMIEKKKHLGHSRRTDLLQLMLDSATHEDIIEDDVHLPGASEDHGSDTVVNKKLSLPEVAANVGLFMLAGSDTTSTAMSYATYVLATHPEEQRKLQEHIDHHFTPETEQSMPSYETISKMDYLDLFLRETLRMYPIAPLAITRQTAEEVHIEGYGTIPAGTSIIADMFSLHYNENLWGPPDPYQFCPERFNTKRHPMAWIPFGAGPRNCVGMRFALLQIKMLLVRLLKDYTLVYHGEKRQDFMQHLEEFFNVSPKNVLVQLERRHRTTV